MAPVSSPCRSGAQLTDPKRNRMDLSNPALMPATEKHIKSGTISSKTNMILRSNVLHGSTCLRNSQLGNFSTGLTRGRNLAGETAAETAAKLLLTSEARPNLTNRLLGGHTSIKGNLSASAKRVKKLTSTLTSSCHLNTRLPGSTSLKSTLILKPPKTVASLLSQTKSTSIVQQNTTSAVLTPSPREKQTSKKLASKRSAEEEVLVDTLPKKPKYNIDWSDILGDEQQVMMDLTNQSPVEREQVEPDLTQETKKRFINIMSAALLKAPNFKSVNDETRISFVSLCERVADIDPEFVLKVAIYSRKDLNLRSVTSFLLAFAAHRVQCRPFLKKYFSRTIVLPSDWIEVAEIYQTFQDKKLNFGSLPTALRKVMVEKFPEFDKYQLGKYNKDKKPKLKKGIKKKEQSRMERHLRSGIAPAELVPDEDVDGSEKEVELKTFTLKQLIRQLHISSPVDNVMALIGKKYPLTREEFYQCKLPGEFDESMTGKRMRLSIPETWETQVSMKGNKAEVWQSLIDHKKLPFMAMLRNIRNMLKAGISEKHHQWVIGKLTDEGSIAYSKQFPFRFFSAYTVLDGLVADYEKHQEKLVEIASKLADGDSSTRVGGKKKTKEQRRSDQKKDMMRTRLKQDLKYDVRMVERYRKALDTSVELATNYNVPPIAGVTLILVNIGSQMFCPCVTYKGMGKPRQVVEVGLLLGLMCKHACESSELVLYADGNHQKTVSLDKQGILASTASLVLYANSCNNGSQPAAIPNQLLQDILLDRRHIDNVILLSNGLTYDGPDGEKMEVFLKAYRHLVNPRLLFVSINLSSKMTGVDAELVSKHPNDVFLAGFSDQLLRFVAERGDAGQIRYVENIDVKYNLISKLRPESSDEKHDNGRNSTYTPALPLTRSLKWRVAKVFISSTFLDMHGERDILTRFVFPEIRQWARKRLVNVLDVDLRWGVSQHDSMQSGSLALCFNELASSDYFIAILGDRVGWIPSPDELPSGEEYEWIRRLPQPQSATALEIQLAMRTKAAENCFYFIRTDQFIRTVPAKYQPLFEDSPENSRMLDELKDAVRKKAKSSERYEISISEVFDNYPAKWAGVVDTKPMAEGLEQFALRAMKMIKERITADYPLEDAYGDEMEMIREWQDHLIEEGCSKFKGRHGAIRDFHRDYNHFDRGICLIHGDVGVGKTAFWTRVSHELSQDYPYVFRHTVCPEYDDMSTILRRLYHEMCSAFCLPHDTIYDYYEQVEALSNLLTTVSSLINSVYIIMIDGIDYLSSEQNPHSLNWLPTKIPQNIVFLLSCTTNSTPYKILYRRDDVVQLELKPLDVLDKTAIVKENLAKHGKALDESPFNNQMKLLTGKRSASNPLYLMLACEELRFHGVFEQVNEKIKKIPQTLPNLLDYILSCLEEDFGKELTSKFMSLLYCLPRGGTINTVKMLLSVYMQTRANASLNQVLSTCHEMPADDMIPSLIFTQLLHRINCFVDNYDSNSVLRLSYVSVKDAIRKKYMKASETEQHCHDVISAYYISVIESLLPQPFNTAYYKDIIYHLKCCCQFTKVKELLTSLKFLHSKCSIGLVTSLNADYMCSPPARTGSMAQRRWSAVVDELKAYSEFIYKNTHLLLSGPTQLVQLALNEPEASVICQAAREVVDTLNMNYIDWVTKPDTVAQCQGTIETETVVQCSAISPDGRLLALGGEDCRVHIYSLDSSEEKMTLVGHAHIISDLCFIGNERLMSASHDNSVSLWDVNTGHRCAIMDKHTRRVSSCASTKISLLTAGWDGLVKMWTKDGKLKNDVCRVPSPINDMSIHPDEVYAAIACWDSSVKIFNILTNKRLAVLHGHKSSVRSVSYSNTGNYISSVALDGEIKLWSALNGSQMGSFKGHNLPVSDLCFSMDGDRLITASEDCRVKVWSGQLGLCVEKWPEVVDMNSPDSVCCVAIDSRCSRLAAGTIYGYVLTFDLADMNDPSCKVKPEGVLPIPSLCWGADGRDVFCATSKGSLYKWTPCGFEQDAIKLITPSNGQVTIHSVQCSTQWLIAYTDASGTVTVCSYDGICKKSNVEQHTGAVLSCSFTSDGNLLATGGADGSIVVWTVKNEGDITLSPYTIITQAHSQWVTSLAWSDCVNQLASASTDCLVKLWDFSKSAPPTEAKQELSGHAAAVTSISYRAGCIVSTSEDGILKVWSQKGSEVTSINCKSGAVNACSLGIFVAPTFEIEEGLGVSDWASYMEYEESVAKDNKATKAKMRADMVKNVLVAVGTANGEIQLWNPLQANETEEYTYTSAALSVCCHDDKLVSTHLDKSVKIWTLPKTETVQTNVEHSVGQKSNDHQITYLAQMDNYLFSGSFDGHLTVWGTTETAPLWLRQLKCSTRAISVVTPFKNGLDVMVYVGSEDGSLTLVQLTVESGRITLSLVTSMDTQKNLATQLSHPTPEVSLPLLHIEVGDGTHVNGILLGDHTSMAVSDLSSKYQQIKQSFPSSFGLNVKIGNLDKFVVEMSEGSPVTKTSPGDIVTCVTSTNSGEWLGTDKGYIGRTEEMKRAHSARITSITDMSSLVVTGSTDTSVKLWRAVNHGDNLELMAKFTNPAPVTCMACQKIADNSGQLSTIAIYIGDALGVVNRLDFHY